MKTIFWKKALRRAAALPLALLGVLFLNVGALASSVGSAAAPGDVPNAPESVYVYDGADALSPETETALVQAGKNLEQSCQSQLVVAAMRTIPASGSAERVAFADQIIKSWNIGGDAKRGLLLLLSVEDADYWAVAGAGLKEGFPSSKLKTLLDTHLESDFSAQSYDAGVTKFYTAAAQEIASYAGGSTAAHSPETSSVPASGVSSQPASPAPNSSTPAAPTAPPAGTLSELPSGGGTSLAPVSQSQKEEQGLPLPAVLGIVLLVGAALMLGLYVFLRVRQERLARRRRMLSRQRRIHSSAVTTLPPRHYSGEMRSSRNRYR